MIHFKRLSSVNNPSVALHHSWAMLSVAAVFCQGVVFSCGPISRRGVRTQAVREEVSVQSHNCSSFLSSMETVAFHICALGQFLQDKKTLLCFLTADLCVLSIFLRQVLRRKSWLSKYVGGTLTLLRVGFWKGVYLGMYFCSLQTTCELDFWRRLPCGALWLYWNNPSKCFALW